MQLPTCDHDECGFRCTRHDIYKLPSISDTVSSLIKDAADFCTQCAKRQRYMLGINDYSTLIRATKERYKNRAIRLGLTCDPNKERGDRPDTFGSLLGKELSRRKAVKRIAKRSPYYADPMPVQKNKTPIKSQGEQLELFSKFRWRIS